MIVITGGSGFLGSWIARALQSENIPVVVLVRPDSDCWRLDGLENIKVVRQPPEDWPKTIGSMRPNVVLSCDWEGVQGANRGDPQMQFGNVSRIYALGDAAKKSGAEVFIAFGSQAEIGPHSHPVTEIEEDNPVSSYGEAKVQLRQQLLSLFAKSNTRFVWGRIFSIYGPMDVGAGMLPTLIRTLKENKVFKATKGDQTWSYLYASDFASAVLRLIEGSQFHSIVNIGNPEGVQVKAVISAVTSYMNQPEMVSFGEMEIDSMQSRYLVPVTTSLSRQMWRPQITIEDGIRRTVDWFAGIQVAMDSQKLPSIREL